MASLTPFPSLDGALRAGFMAPSPSAGGASLGWGLAWDSLTRVLQGLGATATEATPGAHAPLGTGFSALDAVLPEGGWQAPQVAEIFSPGPGHPELAIVAPLLQALAAADRPVALIGCPRSVDDHTLAANRLLLPSLELHTARRLSDDTPTAASTSQIELACAWMQGHADGALVVWQADVTPAQWRTLRRACRLSRTHLFLVRPALARWDDTPADLSLSVLPSRGHALEVRVRPSLARAAVSVLLPVRLPEVSPRAASAAPATEFTEAKPGTASAVTRSRRPASHLKVTRDPRDLRRTAIIGSMAEVCRELDRLVALEAGQATA